MVRIHAGVLALIMVVSSFHFGLLATLAMMANGSQRQVKQSRPKGWRGHSPQKRRYSELHAGVAELVYASDLKSGSSDNMGSNPISGTCEVERLSDLIC